MLFKITAEPVAVQTVPEIVPEPDAGVTTLKPGKMLAFTCEKIRISE